MLIRRKQGGDLFGAVMRTRSRHGPCEPVLLTTYDAQEFTPLDPLTASRDYELVVASEDELKLLGTTPYHLEEADDFRPRRRPGGGKGAAAGEGRRGACPL
jgi:hypothetical protein